MKLELTLFVLVLVCSCDVDHGLGLIAPGTGGMTSNGGSAAPGIGGAGGGTTFATTTAPVCPCSRRPGSAKTYACPLGTGVTVTQTVDAAGGIVDLTGTPSTLGVPFRVTFPPNDILSPVSVTLTETTMTPPVGYVDESPVFSVFSSPDFQLVNPAMLVLPYRNNQTTIQNTLAIYMSSDSGATWSRVADSYINAGFLQGSLLKPGLYFAGYSDSSPCGG
jgi:hypothetical protein